MDGRTGHHHNRSNVILLRPNNTVRRIAAPAEPDAPLPEPAQLYGLIALAFLLHIPTGRNGHCVRCDEVWPCDHLRLAYRLREGF